MTATGATVSSAAGAGAAAPPLGAAAPSGVFSQAAGSRGAGAASALAGGLGGGEGSRGGLPGAGDVYVPADDATAPDFWKAPPPENGERLFAGCWFTLAALAGDKGAEDEATEAIRWGPGERGAVYLFWLGRDGV